MLRVEMLSTGDEVLHGQILDTNAAWLGDYLFQQGLPMSRRETVGDSLFSLIETLKERSHIANILIVNGGLGPTSDDLSASAAAHACDVELVEQATWLAHMSAYFSELGRPMTTSNRKQAQIPANAAMLSNPIGTACGFRLYLNKCLMFFTPGVPAEFKVMVKQKIMPHLHQRFTLPKPLICLRLTTFGAFESDLATQLNNIVLPPNVVLGYRACSPIIELKLTGPLNLHTVMMLAWEQIKKIAGDHCIFEGTSGLPTVLTQRLRTQGLTLALSEQFSAGLLHLQLQRAGAPLVGGEVLPEHCVETLDAILVRARSFAELTGAPLVLAVSAMHNNQISVALYTPFSSIGQTLSYHGVHHNLQLRQTSVTILALDMLRRWLDGSQPCCTHSWLKIIKTIKESN
ncbi:nicotinamide mononucleotide deamidase-related protein YfaY [Candidatus Gillettellia adelgis]